MILADENGMAGTRQMSELATWARRSDAKIIQVGDSHQLAAVPASGTFAEITRRHGARELTEVRRQRDPAEIDALAALRLGDATAFVEHLLRYGRILIAADRSAAVADAARWYDAAASAHGPQRVAVICRDNALRAEANAAIRRLRAARGALAGPAVETDDSAFQVGDRVICRRNDRQLDVDNGTRATVSRVHAASRALELRSDDGRRLHLPARYLDAGHLEHAYALTAHALQGSTLETACVLSRPDDHDRQWTYTASSRTRGATTHVVLTSEGDVQHATARLLKTIARDASEPPAHQQRREPFTDIADTMAQSDPAWNVGLEL